MDFGHGYRLVAAGLAVDLLAHRRWVNCWVLLTIFGYFPRALVRIRRSAYLRLFRTVLGERRLWAFALEMVPTPGKRAVNAGRRSAETVLDGKVAVAFSGVIVDCSKTKRSALINGE